MSSSWLVRVLVPVLSLYGTACQASLDPDITQVDLIFPRNGSTYRPVYPFPVVVAVTNAHLVWPYSFDISWQFRDKESVQRSGSTSPGYESYNVDDQVSPDSPLLLTWGNPGLINTTQTQFVLLLTASIFQTCPPNGSTERTHAVQYDHVVLFNLADDGELPDVEAAGPEPDPIGAFEMRGRGKDKGHQNRDCPRVEKGPGEKGPVDPFAFTIDSGVADAVEARMLEIARCNGTGQSWPNATGMLGHCPRDSSGSMSYSPAGILLSWGTATALAIALGCV